MSARHFAGWVPGLPHLLHPEKSAKWSLLHRGCQGLAASLACAEPDVLVVYSTQWISVLGTSFQAHPSPRGVHIDENWYELGDLGFDFKSHSRLGDRFATASVQAGIPAKTVCYDEFPIDTGSIVALRLLNPQGRIPVALVSSCVYSDAKASHQLGQIMRDAVESEGLRAAFIACSGLSARFFTDDIEPDQDRISQDTDDEWNRRILGLLEAGEIAQVSALAGEFASQALVDMRFNAFHWLSGALGADSRFGRVLAYGPLWGTGAAVIEFPIQGETK